NMLVKVMRVFMKYVVVNFDQYRKDNPVHDIKLFKLGEHRAWTTRSAPLSSTMAIRHHATARLYAREVHRATLRRHREHGAGAPQERLYPCRAAEDGQRGVAL